MRCYAAPPIQVIIQNYTQRIVDPKGAAMPATTRIANFNETSKPTINIYTDASSLSKRNHSLGMFN